MSRKTGGKRNTGTGAKDKSNAGTRLLRLDRLLAQEGFGTRSEVRKAVRGGRASVNGTVEKDPGRQVSPEDEIRFDDKLIGRAEFVYYMLYKPAGVITATEDSRSATVLDLLREPGSTESLPQPAQPVFPEGGPQEAQPDFSGSGLPQPAQPVFPEGGPQEAQPDFSECGLTASRSIHTVRSVRPVLRRGLFPVGRLDRDTEGLLLITDDGQMAHRLLSPGRHVDKVYYAVVTGQVTEEDRCRFAEGLYIDESLTAMPALLRTAAEAAQETDPFSGLIPEDPRQLIPPGTASFSSVLVTIREGKFHQIKRMFAAVGKEVLYLRRLSMGPLLLDPSLSPGEFRELTQEEINLLRHS